MKFDNQKVNSLLNDMELILKRVKANSKDFHRKLSEKKAGVCHE